MTRHQKLGKVIAQERFKKFGSRTKAVEPMKLKCIDALARIERGQQKRVDVFWLNSMSILFGVDLYDEIINIIEEEKKS